MSKDENRGTEKCCDCGNTKQLMPISLPYVDVPKFRCKKCSLHLYNELKIK